MNSPVTDPAGSRLALVRFPAFGYNQQPPPARIVWTMQVPDTVADLASTINPSGAHFAVLRHANSVSLATWDDSGPKIQPAVQFPGKAVDAVAPAVHASVSGVVRASILTTDAPNERKFTLTEFTWRPGAPPATKAGAPFDVAGRIRSGTIAYSMAAVEAPRREWYLVLEDRKVQSSRSGGKAVQTKRLISVPPQLLAMSEITYILELAKKPQLSTIQ
ncbi:MAG: hypothetical protein ACRD5L_04140 [Bryobacteraceae bacterium]